MKFLLRSLLLLIILITILLTPFLLWLRTDKGLSTINDFIVGYIEKKTNDNYKIKIENINFTFPMDLKVQRVTLNDKKGQAVIVENFYINIMPSSLWLWEINILNITADQVILIRSPNADLLSDKTDSKNQVSQKDNYFIPNINIKNFAVENFILLPSLTNLPENIVPENIGFNLQASANFDSKDKTLHFLTKSKAERMKSESADQKSFLIDGAFLEMAGKFDFINNSINVSNFKLSSFRSNIEGIIDINFSKNLLIGNFKYNSSIFEYLFPDHNSLKSLITGKVGFSGALNAPHIVIDGEISFEDSEQNYFRLPKLVWQSDFVVDKDNMNGQISFDAGTIKANGKIGKNDSKIYLKDFTAKGQNLISTANMFFDSKTKAANGVFNISSNDIYELNDFFPFLEKGQLDIKTTYKQSEHKIGKLDVLGNMKYLSTSFGSCDFINFDLALENLWDLKLDHLDIKLRSLTTNYGELKNFALKAKSDFKFTEFDSHIELLNPHLVNLKVNGSLITSELEKFRQGNSSNFQITHNINGTIGKVGITTPQAIKMTIGKIFSIVAPEIKANDGKINLNLTMSESQLQGKLVATKIPTTIMPNLLPSAFDRSLISINTEINGSLREPIFNTVLETSSTELLDKNNIPASLKLSSHIQNNNLSIDAQILQEKKVLGDFKLQIPCKFSLSPFQLLILKQNNINANLKFVRELNILALLPLPESHKLKGYLNGELDISGNLESLAINGMVAVSKAEYKYQNYGVKLKNISATLIAKGKNLSISNLIAQDDYSNSLEGGGSLSVSADLPFKFHINTKKFSFINTPYLQGEAQGALSISGNNKKAFAQGKFDLGPMEIKIPEHFSDNIPTINIIEITNHDKVVYETSDNPYILQMDLDLNANQQVYVRGWGVNTLLLGNLKLSNNITDPHIFGQLKSVRGRYQEFGKLLNVREGILVFNGPISPSPYLNIVGTTMVGGTEIRLILAGSIFTPDIRIESTPSLSQQDALSLLLFGKNPDNISTMQAIGLANGMRKLSGNSGGFDPIGFGRKILGVDDISIRSDDNLESSYVGLGKHITDKVYLEIEEGTEVFRTKTKIEVELTPKISVEAITSEKGASSFGINWQLDY